MHAEVDERDEVGNDAFEHHLGFQVGDFANIVAPFGSDELVARAASRIARFLDDAGERMDADGLAIRSGTPIPSEAAIFSTTG